MVDEKPPIEVVDHDQELDNLVGNMLIGEFQVDKIRTRLQERVAGYGSGGSGSSRTSSHVYKHNGKYYRITIKVEEIDPQKMGS